MKKLFITLAAILVVTGSAYAEETKKPKSALTWQEKCQMSSDMAEDIMTWRLEGVSAASLIKAFQESSSNAELANMFIIDAYKRERWGTEAIQKEMIEDFRDEKYIECVELLKPE